MNDIYLITGDGRLIYIAETKEGADELVYHARRHGNDGDMYNQVSVFTAEEWRDETGEGRTWFMTDIQLEEMDAQRK